MTVVAVRLYLRYGLSYRDVEELLLDRGAEVDHVTIFRRVDVTSATVEGVLFAVAAGCSPDRASYPSR